MSEINQLPIITISREYGAGGRSVARSLAGRLGIEFYDKDFVKMTAQNSGYSEEDIKRVGEELSSRSWFMNAFVNTTAMYTSSHDAIFKAEREAILELSKQGPCIIIGRCANVILREVGIPSFDIFLYADKAFRVKRAQQLGENGDILAEKYVEKRDHYRSLYYKTYTGYEIGDYRNYNICLDTGRIGFEACVDLLEEILKKA